MGVVGVLEPSIGPGPANDATNSRSASSLGRIGSDNYIVLGSHLTSVALLSIRPKVVSGQTYISDLLTTFSLATIDPSKDATADYPRPLHRSETVARFASE